MASNENMVFAALGIAALIAIVTIFLIGVMTHPSVKLPPFWAPMFIIGACTIGFAIGDMSDDTSQVRDEVNLKTVEIRKNRLLPKWAGCMALAGGISITVLAVGVAAVRNLE